MLANIAVCWVNILDSNLPGAGSPMHLSDCCTETPWRIFGLLWTDQGHCLYQESDQVIGQVGLIMKDLKCNFKNSLLMWLGLLQNTDNCYGLFETLDIITITETYFYFVTINVLIHSPNM